MSTKLYLRNLAAASYVAGTLPSGEQSGASPDASAPDATTIQLLSTTKGAGPTATKTISTVASASQKKSLAAIFCTLPLAADATVGAPNIVVSQAGRESSLNARFALNSYNIYVWRPSTGTKVGTIVDMPNLGLPSGADAPSMVDISYTMMSTLGSGLSAVDALAGDIIVFESWGIATQDSATSYSVKIAYDGTTEGTTNGAVVSGTPAAYIQFSETLTFSAATVQSGALSASESTAAAFSGASIRAAALAASISGSFAATKATYAAAQMSPAGTVSASFAGQSTKAAAFTATAQGSLQAVGEVDIHYEYGAVSANAALSVGFVGAQHYAHLFEQEAAGPDGWTKEAGL